MRLPRLRRRQRPRQLIWESGHTDEPRDQQADIGPFDDEWSYWATIGPEVGTRWSWSIQRVRHGDQEDFDGGFGESEEAVKLAVAQWRPNGS